MEQGTVVVYQAHGSVAVWGAEFVTALEAIGSIRRQVQWWPHDVHRPRDALFPEPTAANAAALGRVVVSAHSDVAWLDPRRS